MDFKVPVQLWCLVLGTSYLVCGTGYVLGTGYLVFIFGIWHLARGACTWYLVLGTWHLSTWYSVLNTWYNKVRYGKGKVKVQ